MKHAKRVVNHYRLGQLSGALSPTSGVKKRQFFVTLTGHGNDSHASSFMNTDATPWCANARNNREKHEGTMTWIVKHQAKRHKQRLISMNG